MADGDEITNEEFAQFNKPLLDIDAVVLDFAKTIGGRIIYNYHSRPERRIILRSPDNFTRSIALSCVRAAVDDQGNPLGLRYFLDVGANYDTDHDRTYWVEAVGRLSANDLTPDSIALWLDRAWKRLKDIDLKYLCAHGNKIAFPVGRAVYTQEEYVEHPNGDPGQLQN